MGPPGPTGPPGPNTVPIGSLAAPSINFTGDTDTGIYSPGAGQIALASDGIRFLHSINGNAALGLNALSRDLGVGDRNTAVGNAALSANLGGVLNTAVGFNSQRSVLGGAANTAVGAQALELNETGSDNTAVGRFALRDSLGNSNTAVGWGSLQNLRNGANNIALGHSAGFGLEVGSSNILIGASGTDGSGTIRIGSTQTSTFIAGIFGVTTTVADAIPVVVNSVGQLGTVSSSRRFKFDVADMGDASSGLMRLRPVTFRYKDATADGAHPIQYGLIAEEVAEVNRDLVVYEADGQALTVKYHLLPALLLNEVQRQQRTIDELTRRLEELERRLTTQQR
jgi:hypothetical protein